MGADALDSVLRFIYMWNAFSFFLNLGFNMKKIILSLFAVVTMSVIPSISQAETRFLIETSNGQKSCLWQNGGYSDCVNPEDVRYEVETPEGVMNCLWRDGAYVDCISTDATNADASASNTGADGDSVANETSAVAAEEAAEVADSTPAAVENSVDAETAAAIDASNNGFDEQANNEQYIYDQEQYDPNNMQYDEYSDQLNDGQYEQYDGQYDEQSEQYDDQQYNETEQYDYLYNTGLDSGMTYGIGLGWAGHVYDSNDWLDTFALSLDVGYKWEFAGLELDFDMSSGSEDKVDALLWTFSITPMIVAYIPFGVIALHSIGFGLGWSGWCRDNDYVTDDDSVSRDHIDKTYYSGKLNSGTNMSLKLFYRFDIVMDHFFLGLELSWIPFLETGNNKDIVDNLIGLSLRIGNLF